MITIKNIYFKHAINWPRRENLRQEGLDARIYDQVNLYQPDQVQRLAMLLKFRISYITIV